VKTRLAILLAAPALTAVFSTSCTSTVLPEPVVAKRASFDEMEENSGVIEVVHDPSGRVAGWIVTARARARYNALIEKYGSLWTPAIGPDYGVTALEAGRFLLTNEAMEKFIVMSAKAVRE
jgi:hypothetical protein